MRSKVADESIQDDPETIAGWVRDYSAEKEVIKIKLEKKGDKWKLTIYYKK